MLIAVTGPDGSGKTSLVMALWERLLDRGLRAETASAWDSGAGLFDRENIHGYLATLDPEARAYFIFHALSRALAEATARGPEILIADGYWFKYAATEASLGASLSRLSQAASLFPRPALTLSLEVTPQEAARRKTSFTPVECGLGEISLDGFLAFQTRTRTAWSRLSESEGPWASLPESASLESKTQFGLIRILKERATL